MQTKVTGAVQSNDVWELVAVSIVTALEQQICNHKTYFLHTVKWSKMCLTYKSAVL